MDCDGNKAMLKILEKPDTQYFAGIMQRYYEWTQSNLDAFIDSIDFIDLEKNAEYSFNGIILKQVSNPFADFNEISITDGQQRLITISIFIIALCAFIENNNIKNKKIKPRNIINKYIINPDRDGDQRYKLRPRGPDFETFKMLIDDLPKGNISLGAGSSAMIRAYRTFYNLLNIDNYEDYFNKLRYLTVVYTWCEKHEDENRIFSNINTGGRDVDLFTKMKAYALSGVDLKTQELYYDTYFADVEKESTNFRNGFAKAYLIYNHGYIPRDTNQRYTLFKRKRDSFDNEKDFFKDFSNFREIFFQIYNNSFGEKKINEIIEGLRLVFAPGHYGLIMKLTQYYNDSIIDEKEFIKSINILRKIGIKVYMSDSDLWNKLRRRFCDNVNWLSKNNPYKSIIDRVKYYNNYIPTDNQFSLNLRSEDMYTSSSDRRNVVKHILLSIENNHMGAGRINSNHFSIEHICPQNPSRLWSSVITEDEHHDYVHSLGNLTLLAKEHNSSNSNASFEDKKMVYNADKLYLSRCIASYSRWDVNSIQERSRKLSEEIVEIFGTDGDLK